jgi:hypothetical protein
MAHLIIRDEKYPDFGYDDAHRSYPVTRTASSRDYRFGKTQKNRVPVRARNTLKRVNGYFRNMIESIASSKLNRMERKLKLRSIQLDNPSNDWIVGARPSERSR